MHRRIENKPASTPFRAIRQRKGEDDAVPDVALDRANAGVILLHPQLAGIAVHQPDANNIRLITRPGGATRDERQHVSPAGREGARNVLRDAVKPRC